MRGRVGLLVVFGLFGAGCGADAVPSEESPVSGVEAVVEDVAALDELASLDEGDAVDVVSLGPSELMGLGWVLGDDGLLHPPALEFEEGYAPEDQSAYFTFVNNSGYNLDLVVSVKNDEGSDQSSVEFNKESSVGLAIPLGDDVSFGFVLMRAGSSSTYSFVGDRGGAPCEDRLSEIGPGSSWTVEFVPTDGGTFGFPGVLTSDDGVECTFGMLTEVQSFVTDHPVWTAVIVVVLATVVVATGFKIAKARGLRRAAAGGEIMEITAIEGYAPEVIALDAKTIERERKFLEELKQAEFQVAEDFWGQAKNDLIAEWGFEEEEISEFGSAEDFARKLGAELGPAREAEYQASLNRAFEMVVDRQSSKVLTKEASTWVSQRYRELQRAGLVARDAAIGPSEFRKVYESFLNQRRFPSMTFRYQQADYRMYEKVLQSGFGDEVTMRSYLDPSFSPVEWEEMYLAAVKKVEAAQAGAVG